MTISNMGIRRNLINGVAVKLVAYLPKRQEKNGE